MYHMQGQANVGANIGGTSKQQAGAAARPGGASGVGGMSIAEQAAQMAARRGKPPAAPMTVTQSSSMVRSTQPPATNAVTVKNVFSEVDLIIGGTCITL